MATQHFETLNGKGIGRLLAAGGIYNGNVEGFRQTAEQLGGDATAGYEQVLNETTKGIAIAAVSVAAGLGLGRHSVVEEVEQLSKLSKLEKPTVTAEMEVNGKRFVDTNQTARSSKWADANNPTLIAERIASKQEKSIAKGKSTAFPNGNMETAHAEVGIIQQAHNAGVAKGANLNITVVGKDVCDYCKGDVPAMGNAAEINSITIYAIDEYGVMKSYNWQSGMKTLERVFK